MVLVVFVLFSCVAPLSSLLIFFHILPARIWRCMRFSTKSDVSTYLPTVACGRAFALRWEKVRCGVEEFVICCCWTLNLFFQHRRSRFSLPVSYLDAALLGPGEGGGGLGDAGLEGNLRQLRHHLVHHRPLLLHQHQLLQLRHPGPACVHTCMRGGWLDRLERAHTHTHTHTAGWSGGRPNQFIDPIKQSIHQFHAPRVGTPVLSKEAPPPSSVKVVAFPAVKSYVDSCGGSSFLPPNPNHDMIDAMLLICGVCGVVCSMCGGMSGVSTAGGRGGA